MANDKSQGGTQGAADAPRQAKRLDDLVTVQQEAVKKWAAYADRAVELSGKGNFTPSEWFSLYSKAMTSIALDTIEMTRILFRD